MTTTKAEVILGSDNYFHWEFAMRMTLARKGRLEHVEVVKGPAEITDAWLLNDKKALGFIAQGVAVGHHTKIRAATSVIIAWNPLRDFCDRTAMHNRVTMNCRLHELKIEDGVEIPKHLENFDELIVGLQTFGEPLDDARQLESNDFTLIEVEEKLFKEYERLDKKDDVERAFKATANGSKIKDAKTFKGDKSNNVTAS
ncbi:hypothetical protein PF005_g21694 [Phytophthora fragariae]|uniref:Retrotransposon Copia-like N-terminal domain-containing protein n=1 Tax=Phytophthora fragariae TaxID=53985 RepID=A0A6A3IMU9_9STRA|nr:hypothetical protein PF011_g21207 [Phytophthora fragariae]KAE9184369.1 hypothetical protein PF005_g21694 [Phytophthora fragariae]KAE9194120.1 hypothetical protein PF004_g20803 [Phytophthora fragariae]KAE9211908.1 hypothetical protein PF002_g18407 [Phytophthora fragariae]